MGACSTTCCVPLGRPMPRLPANNTVALERVSLQNDPLIGTNFGNDDCRFKMLDLLAKGGQARVFRCCRLSDEREFAAKVISWEGYSADELQQKSLDREVAALSQLSHINIVELIADFELVNMKIVVMELMDGMDLSEFIFGEVPKLTEFETKHVFRQMLDAIGYVHSKGFIHRDLKPKNIMTSAQVRESKDGALYQVKLIDFGLSKAETITAKGHVASQAAKKLEREMTPRILGTDGYLAPEAGEYFYSFASDYWCLGVILFCMLCGHHPFDQCPESLGKGIKEDYIYDVGVFGNACFTPPGQSCWHRLSEHAKNLIAKMLMLEYDEWYAPKARYGFSALCQHPWVCSLDEADQWQPLTSHIPRVCANVEIPLQKVCVTNAHVTQCSLGSFNSESLKSIVHICNAGEAKGIGHQVTVSMNDDVYYGERQEVPSLQQIPPMQSANRDECPVMGEFEAMFCDDVRHIKPAVLACCREKLLVTSQYDGSLLRDYCTQLLSDAPAKWLTIVAVERASHANVILFPSESDKLYVGDSLLLLARVKCLIDDGVPWTYSSRADRESFSRRLRQAVACEQIKQFIAD